MSIDYVELQKNIDKTKPDSKENPHGLLKLNLEHPTTKKYVKSGFYIDKEGIIYDTLFWPGDKIKNTKNGILLDTTSEYTVRRIERSSGYSSDREELDRYEWKNWNGNYTKAAVKKSFIVPVGYGKGYDAKNFIPSNIGAINMTALELKKPTLVRELRETITPSGSELTEVGEFLPFDSVSSARSFVTAKIREAVRARNNYPQYRIYTQDSVALAEEPVVTFK